VNTSPQEVLEEIRDVAVNGPKKKRPGKHRLRFRAEHFPFMVWVDPDRLRAGETPPPDVQAALEDVMGPERMSRLKLRLHPLFKRWTLFERVCDPSGNEYAWRPVWLCSEDAVEGRLPLDLQGQGIDHMTGLMGDYRLPDRRDFELLEKFDRWKYGVDGIVSFLQNQETKATHEEMARFGDFTHDWLDHYFWMAMRDAQEHYSRPWSTRAIEPHKSPARWKVEEKDGFSVRTRVWGAEGDENAQASEMAAAARGTKSYMDEQEVDELMARIEARREGKRTRIVYGPEGRREIDLDAAPAATGNVESVDDLMSRRERLKAAVAARQGAR